MMIATSEQIEVSLFHPYYNEPLETFSFTAEINIQELVTHIQTTAIAMKSFTCEVAFQLYGTFL